MPGFGFTQKHPAIYKNDSSMLFKGAGQREKEQGRFNAFLKARKHRHTCPVCKDVFYGFKTKKYCSPECYKAQKTKFNYNKTCPTCGVPFKATRTNQLYCSNVCCAQYHRKPYKPREKKYSTGTHGAISELKVVIDLFEKSYEVFRATSPACSCDLIFRKNKRDLFSVEVRTGYKSPQGTLSYPVANIKADYLAIVTPKEIIYKPLL